MSLTSRGTFFAMVLLVLASIVLAIAMWNRGPRVGWVRWPQRVALILVCQLAATSLAAVALNDTDRFYNSWSELVGGHQPRLKAPSPNQPSFQDQLDKQLAKQHHQPGKSAIVSIDVPEAGAPQNHSALVYLPVAYFDSSFANRQFPVIELLDGFPGNPQTWVGPLHMQKTADEEIAAGRAVPFVAVMPEQNFLPSGGDAECLDIPGGAQVESTLTTSVRQTMLADFRVSPNRQSWALMGYSTGGYCALKMALRFPDNYATAVSILGNTSPYQDDDTGPIFKQHPTLKDENDPMWLLANRPRPDVAVLLASSKGDMATWNQAKKFLAAAKAPLRAEGSFIGTGGHNFGTFNLYQPVCYDWISHQLSAPLAPSRSVPSPTPKVSTRPTPR